MRKLLRWLGLGLVVVVVVAVLARNFVARKSVEVGVTRLTGFPLEIGTVKVGLFNSQLDVTDLKLMNPPEFPDRQFVELAKLHVDYRLGSLLVGVPHINDLQMDIDQIVLVKNEKGETNAQKLNGVAGTSGGAAEKKSTPYRVDQLRIRLGTVIYKDFSRAKATERTYTLNTTVVYKDITDSTDIPRLVLLSLMNQVRLPDLGIQPDDLKKGLGNVGNAAGSTVNAVSETGQSLLNKLKQTSPSK